MIIFDIENKQEEYALCHSIINFCKTGINFDKIFDVSTCDKFVLRYIKNQLESDNYEHNKKIIKAIETSFNEVKPSTVLNYEESLSLFSDLERNANCVKLTTVSSCKDLLSWFTSIGLNANNLKCEMFLFRVKNTNEDDCVNFIYFELIRQYYKDCFICIIPRDVDDVFRISKFYFIENLVNNRSTYNHRYFLNTGRKQIQHLNVEINIEGVVNYAASFMPLIEINDCTYDILSNSLDEIFILEDFLSNFEEVEKLLSMEKQWVTDVLNHQKSDNEIYTYRIKMFLMHLLSLVYESCDWSNIKGSIKNTSVLSFVFFLTFVNSIKTKGNKLETYLLRDLLFDAENFSEGVLQLIENALFHSKYSRYFCYRIHKTTDKNGPEKFKKQGIVSDMGHCLEVLITDYNVCRDKSYTSIIKERFIEILCNNNVDENIIIGFKENLTVKDFFEPSKNANESWEKYYSKPDNVIFHYGLNIFDQVVASSNGYFMMSSSNDGISSLDSRYERFIIESNSNKCEYKNIPVIPGTMYRILLPLNKKNHADFTTGINSDLNFELIKKKETKTIVVKKIFDEINMHQKIGQTNENGLNEKNNEIMKIAKLFYDKILNDKSNLAVLIFDTDNINLPMESEKISKALVSILAKIGKKTKRIAIINATDTLRSVFIRTVGTLYYKDRQRSFLRGIQIFICDENGQKGIVFYGEEIEDSIAATQFLFDEKGEYLHELHKLENIKRKKGDTNKVKSNIKYIFPFDIIVRDGKNDKTIFQKKVIDDINKDITKRQFGCKLEDVHMRVGSKLHIHGGYFEASLLFSISNYVSRFAYLLAEDIVYKYNQNCKGKKLILVGYDTYSEMLTVKIIEILKDRFDIINCNYCIYEEATKSEKFRNLDIESVQDVKFVVIIPIGSSLTTNQKVVKELEREVRNFNVYDNILSNHCVVLIRDEKGKENENECSEIEKDFWSKFDTSLSEVTLKEESEDDVKGFNISNDNKVKFIVCVSHKWFRQDDCPCCYPTKLRDENPIIRVNKSSVIPLIKIGLSEEWDEQPKDEMELLSKSKKGDIKLLKGYVLYGHLSRDDNHFEYYPQTEKLMQHINRNKNLEKVFDSWAKAVGEDIKSIRNKRRKIKGILKGELTTYDFIVAPIHATNTLFIEKINKKAINAKAVIWIDVSSEYRDNVKTKYSFLTSLFHNLTQEGKNAQINFHFVDDTITSGFHISRSKSLLYSLFIKEAFSDTGYKGVKVNLFASVIILVNRISKESKLLYIDDTNCFFDYIDLNISALRSHADACILCNKFKSYQEMLTFSGTNDLAEVFAKKISKYEKIPIDTLTKDNKGYPNNSNLKYSEEDGFLRMLYTHELNSEMNSKKHLQNNKDEVLKILKNKLMKIIKPEDADENEVTDVKKVRNFLYVIATPFFVFRKSALEAAFEFMLNLTEWVILRSEKNDSFFDESVGKFIENMESDKEKSVLSEFLKTLFHRLSILGSNFVIRAKVINAFFVYISEHFPKDKQTEWIKFYVSVIKQTLYLNKQDSRNLWLERLLLNGKEPSKNGEALSSDENVNSLKKLTLLENNTIIHDALQETQRIFESAYGKKIDKETRVDDLFSVLSQLNDDMPINDDKISEISDGIYEMLNSYYCKHYRTMLSDKCASTVLIKKDDPKILTVMHMAFLKVLLIPKYNLYGNQEKYDRFYLTLLKTIRGVFSGCMEVRLFMKINVPEELEDVVYFIDSSVKGEKRTGIKNIKYYWKIEEILKNNPPDKLGDTIFVYEKFCVIQLNPPNNYQTAVMDNEKSNGNYVILGWYFVFEMDKNVELTDEILKYARDLLVMREALVTRFELDFDNYIFQEWQKLDKLATELSIESKGSHTPYEELDDEVQEMAKKIENIDCEVLNYYFSKCLFSMADSYISKWYVNKTIDQLPERIRIDEKYIETVHLKQLRLFLEKSQSIKVNYKAIQVSINFDNYDDDIDADIPDKCQQFFIMMFVELLINAMRHGIPQKTGGMIEVKLEVIKDRQYLRFSNRAEKEKDSQVSVDEGITCKTIKWFYEKIKFPPVKYGYDFNKDGSRTYYIEIPIVKGEK